MDTLHLNDPRVKMVAHRGLSGFETENTCAAFAAAGCRSYFGIETDVHRTLDGQFVIIHDDNTRRVAGEALDVENTDFETLSRLRLLDTDGKTVRRDLILPTLAEYIRVCKKYGKNSVLELKNHFVPGDIDRIIAVIRAESWLERTIFISFDLPNLVCVREKLPGQKAQFLTSEYADDLEDTLKKYRLDLDIYYRALPVDRVRPLHEAGIEINVWTVNDLNDARRLADSGVDYITSNIVE